MDGRLGKENVLEDLNTSTPAASASTRKSPRDIVLPVSAVPLKSANKPLVESKSPGSALRMAASPAKKSSLPPMNGAEIQSPGLVLAMVDSPVPGMPQSPVISPILKMNGSHTDPRSPELVLQMDASLSADGSPILEMNGSPAKPGSAGSVLPMDVSRSTEKSSILEMNASPPKPGSASSVLAMDASLSADESPILEMKGSSAKPGSTGSVLPMDASRSAGESSVLKMNGSPAKSKGDASPHHPKNLTNDLFGSPGRPSAHNPTHPASEPSRKAVDFYFSQNERDAEAQERAHQRELIVLQLEKDTQVTFEFAQEVVVGNADLTQQLEDEKIQVSLLTAELSELQQRIQDKQEEVKQTTELLFQEQKANLELDKLKRSNTQKIKELEDIKTKLEQQLTEAHESYKEAIRKREVIVKAQEQAQEEVYQRKMTELKQANHEAVSALDAEKTKLAQQLVNARAREVELERARTADEQQIMQAKASVKKAKEEFSQLQVTLAKQTQEHAVAIRELDERLKREAKNNAEKVAARHTKAIQEFETKNTESERKLTAAKEKVASLQAEVKQATDKLSRFSSELEENYKRSLAEAKEELDRIQREAKDNVQQVAVKHAEAMKALEAEKTELDRQLTVANGRVDLLQEQVRKSSGKLSQLTINLEREAKESVEKLKAEYAEATQKLKTENTETGSLLDTARARITELEATASTSEQARNTEIQKLRDAHQRQITDLDREKAAEVKAAEEQKALVDEQLTAARAKIVSIQSEAQRREDEHKKLPNAEKAPLGVAAKEQDNSVFLQRSFNAAQAEANANIAYAIAVTACLTVITIAAFQIYPMVAHADSIAQVWADNECVRQWVWTAAVAAVASVAASISRFGIFPSCKSNSSKPDELSVGSRVSAAPG